ncbi:MAG: AMP-binding protein [Deltaproteobacteria bacterium]|nr:AMP-binding protein [Deltaproteobacteria bacterium]MBW2071107.1 AMP-binding protein [Deltaproteobacteria bacterium]
MKEKTLPALLKRNAERYGNARTALREKEYGIWQSVSWQQYYQHVKNFALGLKALGYGRGDKVAIIGDNRPEWLYAELAAQALGAVPLGIYQDSILTEVAYIINHSEARLVVAEDQEQVDKILEMQDELPRLERIVYTDLKGMRGYDDAKLIYFPEVEKLGRNYEAEHSGEFENSLQEITENDVALISYTSGTTGFPKGSLLTHRNMLKMALNLNAVDPKYESDEFVSFLPLPWIGEQMMAVSSALAIGFSVNFPEEPETATADIYEIGPHVMFSPPRVWEGLSRSVMVKHLDATWLKRQVYRLCMPIGYRMADYKFAKKKPPFVWRLLYAVAYLALFRALKDRLGFLRLRTASTGGAALGPDVFRFFHAIGVNLKQIYGQTEISGISCIHRDGDIDFDTVGLPIPETEIRIYNPDPSGVGEIISRSPALFQGYYKDEEATKKTVVAGWLHSGDAGYINEAGHLVCIDRIADLMRLEDGTQFSPMFIENKLKFCPYIVEAVVLGHEKPYVTAMICIDYKHTGKWAEDRRLTYTTYTDLAGKTEVYDLVEQEVVRVNLSLPEGARIRKFLLLYKELDPDDEELTRTKKIRRRFINEKYSREIAGLYSDKDKVDIESLIRYQDGKTSTLRTSLQIRSVDSLEHYVKREKRSFMHRLLGRKSRAA